MAKETGLGWTSFELDDDGSTARDIKNDVNSFDFSTPYGVQEVTGVDKYAIERILLAADFTGKGSGTFNPAANQSHAVLSGDLRVVRTLTLVISAQTLANEVLITEYGLTRASGGEFTWQAPFQLADGTVPAWA